jgi:uncharacterized protein
MFEKEVTEKSKFFLKNAKRFALLILLGFVSLAALSALSLSHLRTEYSMKQFLPVHHPLIEADDRARARFQLPEFEPVFALISLGAAETGTWLESARVEKLKKTTEDLGSIEGIYRTLSLGTIEGASSSAKDGITVGRLLELTPEPLWKERVLHDPILTPHLISADARTVVVGFWIDTQLSTSQSGKAQDEARRRMQAAFPASQVSLGGVPAMQIEMGRVLGTELRNFLLLSLLASVCTLLLFFRSLSSVVVPLVLMVLANLICLGWMAYAGVAFTVLLSTLPVLVALTVVSMSAHTMLRYSSDWQLALRSHDNPNPIRVLFRAYQSLFLPNTLTAITTSIGFFAIAVTNIPLIRQYGLTVGTAIFLCWFVVIGALLPLLVLFPVPEARKWTESRARWALWVTAHKREILVGVSVLCLFMLYRGKDLNWSARLFDDLPRGHEARNTTEFVDNKLGGMIPFDIVIEKDEENAWNDPAALAKLDQLVQRWRALPEAGSVVGATDYLRAVGRVQGRGIPTSRKEAAEYGFLYSFSDDNPLKNYLTVDGRAARITLRYHDVPADRMAAVSDQIEREAHEAFPGWKVGRAGMASTVHALNNELCVELIYGFWQALVLICLVLVVVFRSLRWTIAAALPNLVPVIVLLGALSLCGTPIKPGIALIFSIALGISFDNTVYLLGRLRFLRDRSAKREISVSKAWYQEGNLCLYSSIALSAGFLVFLASFFSLNQQFGLYMLVAIMGGLLGDLVLLPAMLAAFPGMVKDRRVQSASPETMPVAEDASEDEQLAA